MVRGYKSDDVTLITEHKMENLYLRYFMITVEYGFIYVQALTTPNKMRLPIGQPACKNQVAPIKNRVAPFAEPYCKQ